MNNLSERIVERLRDRAYSSKFPDPLLEAAANEIDRLRHGAVSGRETVQSDHIPDAGKMAKTSTNHDAAPAAIADLPDERPPNAVSASGGTPCAASRDGSGTGDTPVAESATPDGYAYTGWPYPRGKAASVSDAEIDALQHVVEDGRFVDLGDYGRIRSLLVRLRPEWESDRPQSVKDAESDRPKPISDERLAALEQLSALDQELELKHGIAGNPMIKAQQRTPPPQTTPTQGSVQGEGSFRDSRNANEPVAWAVCCDGIYDSSFCGSDAKNEADEWCNELRFEREREWVAVPLYRQPKPALTETEAETLRELRDEAAQYADEIGLCSSEVRMRQRIIDSMLERLR